MRVQRSIQKRIRHAAKGVNVVGDVNAAVSASVNEPGTTKTSSSSRQRIVQRSSTRAEASGAAHEHDQEGR